METITIVSPDGMSASILTLGARLVGLRLGDSRPLTLSFERLEQIEADDAKVGVVIGRIANRIRIARLSRYEHIDPRAFLEKNDAHKLHHIHGGTTAWDKRLFAANHLSDNVVELKTFSPHGDQGYPSSVNVIVRYELRDPGQLVVTLTTTNVGAEPTVTNMTVRDIHRTTSNLLRSLSNKPIVPLTAFHFTKLFCLGLGSWSIATPVL